MQSVLHAYLLRIFYALRALRVFSTRSVAIFEPGVFCDKTVVVDGYGHLTTEIRTAASRKRKGE